MRTTRSTDADEEVQIGENSQRMNSFLPQFWGEKSPERGRPLGCRQHPPVCDQREVSFPGPGSSCTVSTGIPEDKCSTHLKCFQPGLDSVVVTRDRVVAPPSFPGSRLGRPRSLLVMLTHLLVPGGNPRDLRRQPRLLLIRIPAPARQSRARSAPSRIDSSGRKAAFGRTARLSHPRLESSRACRCEQ